MIRFQVQDEIGFFDVSLNVDDPNDRAAIEYSRPSPIFQAYLESEAGAFGHLIGRNTSAIDLHSVLTSADAQIFSPVLLEGAELVETYDPQLPDGAVS